MDLFRQVWVLQAASCGDMMWNVCLAYLKPEQPHASATYAACETAADQLRRVSSQMGTSSTRLGINPDTWQ